MSRKRSPSVRPPPVERPPPTTSVPRPKNRLLAALPDDDFDRIRPHLKTVPLDVKAVLLKRGAPIRHVFFPNGGVCSVTAMMTNGAAVEVATVGDEGLIGIAAFFGGQAMPGESMVQVPDSNAERMRLEDFRLELDRRGALYDAVNRYAQATIALIMQSTACMALHGVQERCCRWLLMTHDRVKSDHFSLSHEFLAMMLGSTRPTVTAVASNLQRAKLIRYTHAKVTILNRKGLEAMSCECYATVKTEFDRLGL
jgi:CRP-like cAMP-binding protein